MGDRWTLLTFCRNDGARILANLDRLDGVVDDVVVVDSSDPGPAAALAEGMNAHGARLVRAVPLGNVDLLRPFGVAQVRTERTIYLDADERPGGDLVERLRSLTGADGYVVARREASLGVSTDHLRVFRTSAVAYDGSSHAFPLVRGRTDRVPPEAYLEHDADFDHYFDARRGRFRSIVITEWLERPFDRSHLHDVFTWRAGRHTLTLLPAPQASPSVPALSGPGVRLGAEATGIRESMTRGNLRWGRFQRHYARTIADAWASLSPDQRTHWGRIAGEVRAAGGLRRYLGLEDPDYVHRLTASFPWDRDGPTVLEELVEDRHRRGRPRPPEEWSRPGNGHRAP